MRVQFRTPFIISLTVLCKHNMTRVSGKRVNTPGYTGGVSLSKIQWLFSCLHPGKKVVEKRFAPNEEPTRTMWPAYRYAIVSRRFVTPL